MAIEELLRLLGGCAQGDGEEDSEVTDRTVPSLTILYELALTILMRLSSDNPNTA
jgi:hypothetical protein